LDFYDVFIFLQVVFRRRAPPLVQEEIESFDSNDWKNQAW
jgi:hypothetical protein